MNVHFSATKQNDPQLSMGFVPEAEETDDWATPQYIFDQYDKEFNFTLDPASNEINKKCKRNFTSKDNGLAQSWKDETVWLNPPYGRTIGDWIKKAATGGGRIVVCLIPARTDTRWFHEFIYQKPNVEVRFLKGRLKFGGSKNAAPFPSMVVIFKKV